MDSLTQLQLMDSGFPFKTKLSLEKLVDFWKEQSTSPDKPLYHFASDVLSQMDAAPELRGIIKDYSVIEKNRDAIDLLMSAVFSVGTWEQDIRGAFSPFDSECFYETPRFSEIVGNVRDSHMSLSLEWIQETFYYKVLYAYISILDVIYDRQVDLKNGMIFKTVHDKTKLSKFFGAQINPRFVEVGAVGEPPELTDEMFNDLLNNFQDLDKWMELLPPENFEFVGVTIIEMIDITEQQTASMIKEDLLTQDALLSNEKFDQIQQYFRSLLNKDDVVLGIGAMHKSRNSFLNFGDKKMHFVVPVEDCDAVDNPDRLFYRKVYEDHEHVVIPDVEKSLVNAPALKQFTKNGVHSALIIPLVLDQEIVGILQLGSTKANSLSTLDLMRLKDVLPVLTIAVKRSTEELENQIVGVIKDKFTALHPAIEWKFDEVAMNYLDAKYKDEETEIEDIVFNDVYPLYGSSDIRGSSDERNKATQDDLVEQLLVIRDLFDKILKKYPFPIYRELDFEINNHLDRLRKELVSDDEVLVSDMIHREIEPLLTHIAKIDKELRKSIDAYFEMLDPEFKMIYKRRKDFADSVTAVNAKVYSIIEEEEEKTQEMFPYYFENYKTDGVEYNIYIGQSLVKDHQYNPIYLYNLRLWQLMVMCKVTRETHMLKSTLPIPLETAELILVHSAPLAIRFRTDEKKFDVDGAYNIRYEIMKKRIDKAVIKGTGDRLTQPGMVSIVYSSQKEEEEYLDYIKYLSHLQYIDPNPERVELEYLQGVSGLKALRLKVNLSEDQQIEESFRKELMEVIGPYS